MRRKGTTRSSHRDSGDDGAQIDRAEIDGAEIHGAEIDGAEVHGAEIDGAEIHGAEIESALKSIGAEINRR